MNEGSQGCFTGDFRKGLDSQPQHQGSGRRWKWGRGGVSGKGAFARKTQVCSASWPGKQEPTHNLCRVCVNIYYSLPSSLWLPAHHRP